MSSYRKRCQLLVNRDPEDGSGLNAGDPMSLNVHEIQKHFPGLNQQVHGHRLVYLDSAATTQKPVAVMDAVDSVYRQDCANVHRGVHTLSERATARFEGVRKVVAAFLGISDSREVIFTRGVTESMNLLANTLCHLDSGFQPGDEILISSLDHHANIVPWQLISEKMGTVLKVIPCDDAGELILSDLDQWISEKTRVVSVGHVSNAIGTVNDIDAIFAKARKVGAITILDAAQSAPHMSISPKEIDCDFLTFSGHKTYGPTGAGVLWGKREILDRMPPWQGGGDMIRTVSFEESSFAETPWKFEAGTPDIAAVIGLGAALEFLESIGRDKVCSHETRLLQKIESALKSMDGVNVVGEPSLRACCVSFTLDGVHPHDAATIMDQNGVAIRAGHHCAMPLMKRLGLPATIRASVGMHNDETDVEALLQSVEAVREIFA